MKKVFTIIFSVILLISVFAIPISAATTREQWKLQSGFSQMKTSPDGVSLECTEGLNVWKYTEKTVDITDFSATFTLSQQIYYPDEGGFYHTLMLTNRKEFGNSYGLFLLLMPLDESTLRIEGQILNVGLLLQPAAVHFDVDTTKPITMHGKVLDENHYRISIEGDDSTFYDFKIPVNFPFHTILNGQAYFSFGVQSSSGVQLEMDVSKVNDLDFTGSEVDDGSNEKEYEDDGEIIKPDGTIIHASDLNNASNKEPQSVSKSLYLTLFIYLCILDVVIIAGVLFYFVVIKKHIPPNRKPPRESQ